MCLKAVLGAAARVEFRSCVNMLQRDGAIKVGDLVVAINGVRPGTGDKRSSAIMQSIAAGTTLKLELVSKTAPIVLNDVAPDGAAAGCGLKAGDELISINGERILSHQQATTLIKAAKGEVKVLVARSERASMTSAV